MLNELFGLSPEWSATFLLVLGRLSAVLIVIPLFGLAVVPAHTKIGLAVLLSVIVVPFHADPPPVPTELLAFAAVLGSEVLVGLALGVAVAIVFRALEMAATLVGVQMGFGVGQLFDPLTGAQMESITVYYRLIVMLVFFAVNGHHIVVAALLDTFALVPPGQADLGLIAGEQVVPFFAAMFTVAIRIALPVLGALLLTDLAMGLVARTVPQMNVLVVGFPVKITAGVLVLALSVPLLTSFIGSVFTSSALDLNTFLRPEALR